VVEQLPNMKQRMLLIISIIPMKLSVGKGELVLFAPNVIGFP
jgi:hypothetical protein